MVIDQFRGSFENSICNRTDRPDRQQRNPQPAQPTPPSIPQQQRSSSQQYCSAAERFRTEQQAIALVSCSTSVTAPLCQAALPAAVFPSRPVAALRSTVTSTLRRVRWACDTPVHCHGCAPHHRMQQHHAIAHSQRRRAQSSRTAATQPRPHSPPPPLPSRCTPRRSPPHTPHCGPLPSLQRPSRASRTMTALHARRVVTPSQSSSAVAAVIYRCPRTAEWPATKTSKR